MNQSDTNLNSSLEPREPHFFYVPWTGKFPPSEMPVQIPAICPTCGSHEVDSQDFVVSQKWTLPLTSTYTRKFAVSTCQQHQEINLLRWRHEFWFLMAVSIIAGLCGGGFLFVSMYVAYPVLTVALLFVVYEAIRRQRLHNPVALELFDGFDVILVARSDWAEEFKTLNQGVAIEITEHVNLRNAHISGVILVIAALIDGFLILASQLVIIPLYGLIETPQFALVHPEFVPWVIILFIGAFALAFMILIGPDRIRESRGKTYRNARKLVRQTSAA